MKKIKFLRESELAVTREQSIYCDFCGDTDKEVFTSQYQKFDDESKNETQVCIDCIKQLSKLV